MATKDIENWPLMTTQLLTYASLHENPSEYPHKPYISPETRVLGEHFSRWQYRSIFIRFHIVVSKSEAEKSSQTDD